MRSFPIFILFALAVEATDYYGGTISTGLAIYPEDRVFSRDNNTILSIGDSKRLVRVFNNIAGRYYWDSPCGEINFITLSDTGDLLVDCSLEQSTIPMAQSFRGNYSLLVGNDAQVYIKSQEIVLWRSGFSKSILTQGVSYQMAYSWERIIDEDPNAITVYALDSQRLGPNNAEIESQMRHADYVAAILHGSKVNTSLEVDTMSGNGKTFNERQFVEAVQRFYQKATTDPRYQIINFSGAFRQENSDVADCAIQWIYKKGLYFVAAAGNDGKLRNKYNPYQILVGGVEFDWRNNLSALGTVWSNSSYGKAISVWAPAELALRPVVGTSVAAAKVSFILAVWLTKFKTLRSNSRWGYETFNQLTVGGKLAASDKLDQSPNSLGRLILHANVTSAQPNPFRWTSPRANFCAPLKLKSFNPTENDWKALISLANETSIGDFVGTMGPGLCGCYPRPGGCRC